MNDNIHRTQHIHTRRGRQTGNSLPLRQWLFPDADPRLPAIARRLLSTCLAMVIVIGGGCQEPQNDPSVTDAIRQSDRGRQSPNRRMTADQDRDSAAPIQNTPSDDRSEPIATVNGVRIPRSWLTDELIRSYGLEFLMQRMSLEAVRQEAVSQGVTISPAAVEVEYDRTLELVSPGGKPPTPAQRDSMITQWRMSRGVPEESLKLAMTRQAWLRSLADRRLVVNEEMIQEEFQRLYGAKVECRHIELASMRDAEKILPYVQAGEDFGVLATRHSINQMTAPQGGLLPLFARRDPGLPGVLREAAFQLKIGQTSNPIAVDGHYHILKLERRVAPDFIKLEDVRDSVIQSLRNRKIPAEMDRLLSEIQSRTTLSIFDPTLRRQFEQGIKDGRIVGPRLK